MVEDDLKEVRTNTELLGREMQQDRTTGKQSFPGTKNSKWRNIKQFFEDLAIFSVIYMHRSPLQPLIGPGVNVMEDHRFAHACYLVMLSFVPMAYSIASVPGVKSYISKDADLCTYVNNKTSNCEDVLVTLFMNRFTLATVLFYLILASLMKISCEKSEYVRPSLHTGFWIPKLMLVFILSLVAFSIPPGVFDTIWFYVFTASTIPQSVMVTFLLLDFANHRSYIVQQQQKLSSESNKQSRIYTLLHHSGLTATLIGSLSIVAYTCMRILKHRLLTTLNLVLFVLQFTVIIATALTALIRPRCASNMILVTSYAVLRTGLSLEYDMSSYTDRSFFDLYLLLDIGVVLALFFYCLFRTSRDWFYSYFGYVIAGRAYATSSLTSDEPSDDVAQNMRRRDISSHKRSEESIFNENINQAMPTNLSPRKTSQYHELGCSRTNMNIGSDQRSNTADDSMSYTRRSSYSYHFVYLVFLLYCMTFAGTLMKYNVITERHNKVDLQGSLVASIAFKLSSFIIAVTFACSRLALLKGPKPDSFSATKIITNIAASTRTGFINFMIQAPPFARTPNRARYMYAGVLALGFALSALAVSPAGKSNLGSSILFCTLYTRKGRCLSAHPGLIAVSKISTSVTLFFLLLSVIMFRVETTTSIRSEIHVGFWPSKLLLFGLLLTLSLLIPDEGANFWIYLSLVAMLLVVILQTIFILDATTQVIDCLRKTEDIVKSKKVLFGCGSASMFLYISTITAFLCFYVYFAQFSGCKTNRIFIFINLGLCIIACMVSLHPLVQDGGLAQSAVLTSFCMYCTWSALYNNPKQECNPLANEMLETNLHSTKFILFALDMAAFLVTVIYVTIYVDRVRSFIARFLQVCRQCKYISLTAIDEMQPGIPTASKTSFERVLFGSKLRNPSPARKSSIVKTTEHSNTQIEHEQLLEEAGKLKDSNVKPVPYSYSFFHLLYALFMLHFSLLLITWVNERPGSHIKVNVHWAIMCIRMVASSCSALLYTWSIVAHLLLFSFRQ